MLQSRHIAKTAGKALPQNTVLWKDYRITLLTDRLLRVEGANGGFTDGATQTVWFRDTPPVSFTVKRGKTLTVTTAAIKFTLKEPLENSTVTFLTGALKGKTARANNAQNLRGTYRTLDCCEGNVRRPFGEEKEDFVISLDPGVVSQSGVAYFDDETLFLGEDGRLFSRPRKTDRYFFCYGHDYAQAVKALYRITGRVPPIPRYALGNWWSRYHAYTDKEYLATMRRLKSRNLPFTVATVDMDWHCSHDFDRLYRNPPYDAPEIAGEAGGWTGYTWYEPLFPDYRAFLKKLHEEGYRVTLNLHPADGVRYHEKQYEDFCRAMGVDPNKKERIPFHLTDDRFLTAYFDLLHRPYEREGVDFWWIDWQQGVKSELDGLDPLWALNHYHFLDRADGGEGLILSRYAGIGSHRYPLGFSGDTHITWKTLDYLPYFTANATNAGYAWWSHDIGGHMCGVKEDELFLRFVQFGVFSPINRLHCTGIEVATKEPFRYGECGLAAEEFLRLRHAMIPMLYTAAVCSSEEGEAMLRPAYYANPEEKDAYRVPNQYAFCGGQIVAPVTKKADGRGLAETKVFLPKGRWTDFFTGAVYDTEKPKTFTAYRPKTRLPVFYPAGSVAILSEDAGNDVSLPSFLRVKVYPGTGSYTLIEDEGGSRVKTTFTVEGTALSVSSEGDLAVLPKNRVYRVEWINCAGETCRANGVSFPAEESDGGHPQAEIPFAPALELALDGAVLEKETLQKRTLLALLTEFEAGNDDKEGLWQTCKTDLSSAKTAVMKATFLSARQKKALLEVLP